MDVPTKYALDIYDDWRLLRRLRWLRNSILIIVVLMWIIILALQTWHPLPLDYLFSGKVWTFIWGFIAIFTTALCYWMVTIQQRIIGLIKNCEGGKDND